MEEKELEIRKKEQDFGLELQKKKEDFELQMQYRKEEQEWKILKRKEYYEDQRYFENMKYTNQQSFDKTILTISTLALGISLTLIKDKLLLTDFNPFLLIVSWVCFIYSISANLISYKTAANAFERLKNEVDRAEGENENPVYEDSSSNKLTKFFNSSSLYTLIIGILLLLTFTLIYLK